MTTTSSGMNAPLSLKEPSVNEMKQNEVLVTYLNSIDCYEVSSGMQIRKEVIENLNKIVHQWITQVAKKKIPKKVDAAYETNFGAKVVAFGGQGLGVIWKNGDIDALCIAPNFINRESFFTELYDKLLKLKSVDNLRKVEKAYVPVLQFTYNEIQVDLSLSILRFENIPADLDYTDDNVLLNLDTQSIRSMSGIRDNQLIIDLVPNQDNFRMALKVIKAWAKYKGLHNSAMGYPGGIAWTIMVARICQMYPVACVASLVTHFFRTFSQWYWPQPVLLRALLKKEFEPHDVVQWNPKQHQSDSYHLMPVITPAYPEHNCTFAVNKSSLQVITSLMLQAKSQCEEIFQGKLEWASLFLPLEFFSMYKHYLMITASATNSQGYLEWCGFLESQVRKLVESLEKQDAIQTIHLYPKTYQEKKLSNSSSWFIGLKLSKTNTATLDLSGPMLTFGEQSKTTAQERQLYQEGMKLDVKHIPRKQLERHISFENTG